MDYQANSNPAYHVHHHVPVVDPGKGLGTASLIVALVSIFCCGGTVGCIVSLILGFIANSKSKAAGFSNGSATAGIIISFCAIGINILMAIVLTIVYIIMFSGAMVASM